MEYPRVKPEHAPYRLRDGRIRIGTRVYGIAAEIEDPDGWIWELIRRLDGTRTPEEIVTDVLADRPGLAHADVEEALGELLASGYVEDAHASVPATLTAREQERYGRSAAFFRWVDLVPRAQPWHAQVRLKESRVTVVGLGGTGGTAALQLAASGVGRLHCVDDDVVELSNLNRQTLYTEQDIGRPKVDAALERLRQANSDIEVTGERRRIRVPADFEDLVADCDVLALCADEPIEMRKWVNRVCLAAGRPWVDGGYNGPLISGAPYVPGQGPCFECLREQEERRLKDDAPADPNARTEPPPTARGVIAPSAAISGSLVAYSVMALLTGVPELAANRVYGMNLVVPEVLMSHPPLPSCPACGASR